MQKIIPHLWFENQAEEAVNLYTSAFKNSKIINTGHYGKSGAEISGMLEGSVMTLEFELEGQKFIALNGGPVYKFTPAISFFINCENTDEINDLWKRLSEGGFVLMELDANSFSERFGWIQDKFGVNWQLNLASRKQKITPYLMFIGDQHGKAEEAINLYISLFNNSMITEIGHYGEGDSEKADKRYIFSLDGQEFMAFDSSFQHPFTFSEAISFFVNCETQKEVDKFWEQLSEDGEKIQCGWLKDRYGVSWQIVPTALGELLNDSEKSERVMEAMFQMKKIDIQKLEEAYES